MLLLAHFGGTILPMGSVTVTLNQLDVYFLSLTQSASPASAPPSSSLIYDLIGNVFQAHAPVSSSLLIPLFPQPNTLARSLSLHCLGNSFPLFTYFLNLVFLFERTRLGL